MQQYSVSSCVETVRILADMYTQEVVYKLYLLVYSEWPFGEAD